MENAGTSTAAPLVSIVTPAHNAANTLDATLESVLAQTRRDWEAIVVDDGSSDETPGIIERWRARDDRFRALRQVQRGVSDARNKGAAVALAPWLLFLDADDLIAADHLSVMLSIIGDDPAVALAHCVTQLMTPDGRVGLNAIPPKDNYFKWLSSKNCFCSSGCLLRRMVFLEVGGFDTGLACWEDWDLWQRVARTGRRFVGTDRVLVTYRMRADSAVRDPANMIAPLRQVAARIYAPDPRVADAAPEFVNGMPMTGFDAVILQLTIWVMGIAVGAGKDPGPVLARAIEEGLIVPPGYDAAFAAYFISHGILIGACALPADWPVLWPGLEADARRALSLVETLGNAPDFTEVCFRHLESMVKEQ
jgi:glycosyltransferase involved in cell wall biosynthesis